MTEHFDWNVQYRDGKIETFADCTFATTGEGDYEFRDRKGTKVIITQAVTARIERIDVLV